MGKILITDTLLDNLANSIGEKSGETPPMTLAEMKTAVDNLPDVQPTRSYRVTGGGNQTITPSTNYGAMAQVDLTVPSGTTTAPSTISGTSATISTGTNTLTLSKTVSVTPRVSTAGYISSGTAGNSSVSLTASVPTQAAQTIHPSTSDQTISSGTYLTGTQTIKGVTLTNLNAANIVSGVTVKIGDSTDDDCVASVTGTASAGGYIDVTDTTDSHGGTIRSISTASGTPVIQTGKTYTVTENGTTTITPDTGMTAMSNLILTTNVSSGDTNPVADENDVIFIDYDGKIRYSYSAAEFANLTELPSNPAHEGLTAQGWNWSLSDAKSYVSTYGGQVIGQNYVPTDGKTHVFIDILSGDSFYVGLAVNGSVTIEWGDNFPSTTVTGNSLTTVLFTLAPYTIGGSKEIKIGVNSGSFSITSGTTGNGSTALIRRIDTNLTSTYMNMPFHKCIKKVLIGNNCVLGSYAFYTHFSLVEISIPQSISFVANASHVFQGCSATIILPSGLTNLYSILYYCNAPYVSLPKSITACGEGAFAMYCCNRLYFPPNLTTTTSYWCRDMQCIRKLFLPNITSLNNSYMFTDCSAVTTIIIPNTITNTTIASYAFNGCYYLESITIPSVIKTISSYAFSNCRALTTITIPAAVTSIGNYAFSNCIELTSIHFLPTAPPAVSNTNAFNSLPTTCKIYVPSGYKTAYTSAANYPSSSTYTYIEE